MIFESFSEENFVKKMCISGRWDTDHETKSMTTPKSLEKIAQMPTWSCQKA